jgi:hypothetical protein
VTFGKLLAPIANPVVECFGHEECLAVCTLFPVPEGSWSCSELNTHHWYSASYRGLYSLFHGGKLEPSEQITILSFTSDIFPFSYAIAKEEEQSIQDKRWRFSMNLTTGQILIKLHIEMGFYVTRFRAPELSPEVRHNHKHKSIILEDHTIGCFPAGD